MTTSPARAGRGFKDRPGSPITQGESKSLARVEILATRPAGARRPGSRRNRESGESSSKFASASIASGFGRFATFRLRALAVCLIAVAILSAAGVTYAAFTATTTNGPSTVAAATAFPRCLVDEVMADDPVAYWRLNETSGTAMADKTAQNGGSYVNGTLLGQAGALADPSAGAARFDGAGDHASVPDSGSLDVGDSFTHEAWVKRATTDEDTTLISKGTAADGLWFGIEPDNTLGLWTGGSQVANSEAAIVDAKWHHVAATKSGATRKLYLDGRDVTSGGVNNTFVDNAQPLYLAHHVAYPDSDLNGSLDEVAVYDGALSEARIRAHYNSGRCYRDEPQADAAQAYWRLGEPAGARTAFDGANLAHGLLMGDPALGQAGGLDDDTNPSMSFDGVDDHVDLGDRFDFTGTQAFTAEAWINRGTGNEATGLRRILDKLRSSAPSDGWSLSIVPSTQRIRFQRHANATQNSIDSATAVNPDRWHHIVASYDGATMRLYINGLSQASAAATASSVGNPLAFRVGWGPDAASADHFHGRIDDAAVYPTALSQARIQAHYIAGRSYRDVIMDTDPVAYWRLGEASGTTAASQTTTNNGTYVGSPARIPGGAIAGDADGALKLNGSQYVEVADSASLDTLTNTGLTLEIWLKRRTVGAAAGVYHNLFSKGCDSQELVLYAQTGEVQFYKSCSGSPPLARAGTLISDTNWHHVIATKAGSARKIYLDGVDVTTLGTDQSIATSTVPLRLGTWDSGGGLEDFIDGQIDDAAVYNRALTAQEAKLHYDAGKNSPR